MSLFPARLSLTVFGLLLVTCSSPPGLAPRASAPRADAPSAIEPSSRSASPTGTDLAETPLASTATTPSTTASSAAVAGPATEEACPENMQLVAGDYCTEVEHTCVKQWYAEANKKDVCERFEPESKCVGSRVPKRFCMDRYPWPNQAGLRPEVMNNFYQAQVKCAAVGKRVCTETEWSMACEGPELLPFPYGYVRDTNKCNGDREWDSPNMNKVAARDPDELARLWQGVPNGSQPYCVSAYGVYDLPGNNDEVASSETYASNYRGLYDNVTTGGPWYKGVRNQCRPKIYTHNEGFYYYYLGFRCCAEPDAQVTDPRAPKQIKRGWGFERVERLAGFTRTEMQAKLELKRQGKCDCPKDGRLCKTMCGTLLGPSAKDVELGPVTPEPVPPAHLKGVSTKLH